MKLSKRKVIALALAVCSIATLSFGSLAWFTDDDSVTNDFKVAGSENANPDEIFSVDVWEGTDPDAPEQDGLTYERILPADTLDKVAHVKNTGSYDQYIRVKITVSDAAIWQDVFNANMVPVTEFIPELDLSRIHNNMVGSYLDQQNDCFVYYLYYKEVLPYEDDPTTPEDETDMIVFEKVYISEHLDRDQAAALTADGFQISVQAEAVQTEHVGATVYEAFETVGLLDETNVVNTVWVNEKNAVRDAFAAETPYIVLDNTVDMGSIRINGTTAELFLNDQTLETASAGDTTSMVMTGVLTVSGYGNLKIGNADAEFGDLIHHDNVIRRGVNAIVKVAGVEVDLPIAN